MRFRSSTSDWELKPITTLIEECSETTSDFGKYPLYSFTIEEGVIPKSERYERSFLVKKDGDSFKVVKYNNFVMNPMNLRFGAISYSKIKADVSVSGYYNIFNIDNAQCNDYWEALFRRTKTLKLYDSVATGSLLEKKRVHFSQFRNLKFYIPEQAERRKISLFFSKINERIETQSKIIEDLELVKKGVSNTVFGDKSVIKKSWETVKLSTILKERKTYDIKDSVYPHATLSKEGISAKTDRYNRDFLVKDEEKEYKITYLNDICYNPANLKFGVICLNTFGDAIFSPIYVTYEIDNQCDPYFISLYLTNPTFIGHIRKYEQGTVYERMAVSSEDFLKGEINLPTYEEQLKIAKTFKSIDEKIAIEQAILDKLKEQKKFLLSNMFI